MAMVLNVRVWSSVSERESLTLTVVVPSLLKRLMKAGMPVMA